MRVATLVVLLLFSNSFIYKVVVQAWEIKPVKKETIDNYQVGIVLGGMFEFDQNTERLTTNKSVDRLWQALDLYHSEKIEKLCIVGGSGYVFDVGLDEARQVKAELSNWGIQSSDIIIETESRNTYENAKYTKELLSQNYPEYDKFLLITSASHMRRAKALFAKQGLQVETYSTDSNIKGRLSWTDFIIPNVDTFSSWFPLIKEMVGYLGYKLMGRL